MTLFHLLVPAFLVLLVGEFTLTSTTAELEFRVAGKNPESRGTRLYWGLDSVALESAPH